MKARSLAIPLVLGLFFLALLAPSPASQEKPDHGKILGTWKIEVYAGDQTYVLSLIMTEPQGQLEGKISESMGGFADVAIEEISFDGEIFRFNFASPTPPDGMTRTVKAEFKVGADTMEGTVIVPDMDVTADAKATREAK
jgi:hypothetical protein